MSLTPKREAFCLAYIETGNASEAYRRAYPASLKWPEHSVASNASTLLKNTDVLQRVEALKAEISSKVTKKVAISKQWVLEQLIENASIAKAAEPVLDGEGNPTGEYKTNIAAANRAIELIGKELGMFVDRKEVRTGALDDVPHDEKMAMLDAVRAEIAKKKNDGTSKPLH